ncbi:MAG: hypothetical protein MJ068_03420 [Clostridia bacterium]|nr:hypothetical protein [Clostridia bacterium]
MSKLCDLCGINESTLESAVTYDGVRMVYSFCEKCYRNILESGRDVRTVMEEKLVRVGKVCPECGCRIEDFEKTMLFGCPSCYENMREAAFRAAERLQGSTMHRGKRI